MSSLTREWEAYTGAAPVVEDDKGVDGLYPPFGSDDEGIDVDLADFWMFHPQAGQAQECLHEFLLVGCRLTPKRPSSRDALISPPWIGPGLRSGGAIRKTTSPRASVRMRPVPNITEGPNWGSRKEDSHEFPFPLTMR
jgi:hypothetical protein